MALRKFERRYNIKVAGERYTSSVEQSLYIGRLCTLNSETVYTSHLILAFESVIGLLMKC